MTADHKIIKLIEVIMLISNFYIIIIIMNDLAIVWEKYFFFKLLNFKFKQKNK